MIAALYVQRNGVYFGLPDVDPWDESRDARLYAGPWPVVAHPPCARWCRLAGLVESRGGRKRGDDDGCFAAALSAVQQWGGVLEHPAWSRAWSEFGLMTPPARGWQPSLLASYPGWVCEVWQSAYGHRAQKATWLYYVGAKPPPALNWERRAGETTVSTSRRVNGRKVEMQCHAERSRTPIEFRDVLIAMARSVRA